MDDPDENTSSKVDMHSLPLPVAYIEFLKQNGLDPSIYAMGGTIPRYIRIKPGCESQLKEIEEELGCKLERVVWLPGFFGIPPQIQIASSEAYRQGKIYGMDAASGAAVMALNVSSGDNILDLCAAPGAKLCMLSDLLGNSGSLTGVDVAKHRLAACRTMLQKYNLGDRCRLIVADGTTFSLLPAMSHKHMKTNETNNEVIADRFTEWTAKRSWKERRDARKLKHAPESCTLLETREPDLIFYGKNSGVVGSLKSELFRMVDETEYMVSGYDKVLVDAECTHDGSIKHIQKFEYWGWKTLERRLLDSKRTDGLWDLQLRLLTNGFNLLKAGGSLVYSTCSLTVTQNEDVVEEFLSRNPSAELQDIDVAVTWSCRSGRIPKTVRFDPITSQTSGLFIAKFKKLAT